MSRMPLKNALPLLFVALILTSQVASGQFEVHGTVYDRSRYFAMPGVSVMSTAGRGTMTDSTGQYRLQVTRKDSIFFSYLGKATVKFARNCAHRLWNRSSRASCP